VVVGAVLFLQDQLVLVELVGVEQDLQQLPWQHQVLLTPAVAVAVDFRVELGSIMVAVQADLVW
jgi:hypothetical protein